MRKFAGGGPSRAFCLVLAEKAARAMGEVRWAAVALARREAVGRWRASAVSARGVDMANVWLDWRQTEHVVMALSLLLRH